jgi:iodotyrosine deiodinase
MAKPVFVPLPAYREYQVEEMQRRALEFLEEVQRRRSVRDFSGRHVPRGIIEDCLRAAGTAPSGANMQPWHFAAVADPEVRRRIRLGAEEEEKAFYRGRASGEWLAALEPLGTGWEKPFLETAPWLIVVFAQVYGLTDQGDKVKHYYVQESVGIATGILITALHHAGLATLTHTPSPMRFLNRILRRPRSDRPYLILVTGYPAEGAMVPVISKKRLDEFATFI